jgi:hypothetical protein
MSKAWAGGSTRLWRKQRAEILVRDGYVCRVRIPGVCTHRATCVHHTKGRGVTGDDPRFMVAACMPCNLRIGDPSRHVDPKPKPITRW